MHKLDYYKLASIAGHCSPFFSSLDCSHW